MEQDNIHSKIEDEKERDYDLSPIKIIDYGVLLELNVLILIVIAVIPVTVINLNSIIESKIFFNFEAYKFYALVGISIWFCYKIFITYPKQFKQDKSYFLFTNNFVEYNYFGGYKDYKKIQPKVKLSDIQQVEFCIVNELRDRYGRWHKLTSWQLYKKSSIGVHIGKVILFMLFLIQFILFILPYKLWRLSKNKETFTLLNKNIVIHFNNRNYFLINIYTKNELNELIKYFESKNIKISNHTHFIPHLQNHSLFMDKEEIWTNNFNLGEENEK